MSGSFENMELAHSDGLKILMGKVYFSVRNFGYVTRLERRDGVEVCIYST